jgi:hypothetical protein
MRNQRNCSACTFLSRQVGPDTPCPIHAGSGNVARADDYSIAIPRFDEPSVIDKADPATDRLGPFTLHEYARLLLLRRRVQDRMPLALPGVGEAGRLEDTAACLDPWACPVWLRPYLGLVRGLRGEPAERLLNDRAADAESDPARAWRIDQVRAQVRLLETLHARGLLRSLMHRRC